MADRIRVTSLIAVPVPLDLTGRTIIVEGSPKTGPPASLGWRPDVSCLRDGNGPAPPLRATTDAPPRIVPNDPVGVSRRDAPVGSDAPPLTRRVERVSQTSAHNLLPTHRQLSPGTSATRGNVGPRL